MVFLLKINIKSHSDFSFASSNCLSDSLATCPILKYSASLYLLIWHLLPWLSHGYLRKILFSSFIFPDLQIILMTCITSKKRKQSTFFKILVKRRRLNCLDNHGDIDERISKGQSCLFPKFRFLFDELVSWKSHIYSDFQNKLLRYKRNLTEHIWT